MKKLTDITNQFLTVTMPSVIDNIQISEMMKIVPFCLKQDEWAGNTYFHKTEFVLPEDFSMDYKTNRGVFQKRMASEAYKQGYKMSADELTKIGNIASSNKSDEQYEVFISKVSKETLWQKGQYNDPTSCYFNTKIDVLELLEGEDFYSMQVIKVRPENMKDLTIRQLADAGMGISRCWLKEATIKDHEGIVLFNTYSNKNHSNWSMGRILNLLGFGNYSKIQLGNYNFRNKDGCLLYINDNKGVFVSPTINFKFKGEGHLFKIEESDYGYDRDYNEDNDDDEYDYTRVQCEDCYEYIPESHTHNVHCGTDNLRICSSCFEEKTYSCYGCNEDYYIDDTPTQLFSMAKVDVLWLRFNYCPNCAVRLTREKVMVDTPIGLMFNMNNVPFTETMTGTVMPSFLACNAEAHIEIEKSYRMEENCSFTTLHYDDGCVSTCFVSAKTLGHSHVMSETDYFANRNYSIIGLQPNMSCAIASLPKRKYMNDFEFMDDIPVWFHDDNGDMIITYVSGYLMNFHHTSDENVYKTSVFNNRFPKEKEGHKWHILRPYFGHNIGNGALTNPLSIYFITERIPENGYNYTKKEFCSIGSLYNKKKYTLTKDFKEISPVLFEVAVFKRDE